VIFTKHLDSVGQSRAQLTSPCSFTRFYGLQSELDPFGDSPNRFSGQLTGLESEVCHQRHLTNPVVTVCHASHLTGKEISECHSYSGAGFLGHQFGVKSPSKEIEHDNEEQQE
jgi:hypothetical protein